MRPQKENNMDIFNGEDIILYNGIKDLVLSRLLEDNAITKGQQKQYSEKWQIIAIEPSWFKKWKDIFCKEVDSRIVKYVRFED